jgi:cell fate (sporulation/competence/biofilm development) regulator YlbF (YheA/YmcA/DUF963 family)
MNNSINLHPELDKATDNLIQNLLASEPFLAYQKAQAQYKGDSYARDLIGRLSGLQAELRRNQAVGQMAKADIQELRSIQDEVRSNATLIAHTAAQQGAISFLREINQEISQLLGMDFASLAKKSGCC